MGVTHGGGLEGHALGEGVALLQQGNKQKSYSPLCSDPEPAATTCRDPIPTNQPTEGTKRPPFQPSTRSRARTSSQKSFPVADQAALGVAP